MYELKYNKNLEKVMFKDNQSTFIFIGKKNTKILSILNK